MSDLPNLGLALLIGLAAAMVLLALMVVVYIVVLMYQKAKYRAWRDALRDVLYGSEENKK